ncbi:MULTISPECIES: hypothetical protein [Planktothrix]|uniref:hypothetical protein n=1 Tax=Planktothrix TaxID=54304 RepID=UPI00041F9DE9|nr:MULTISPECIES: hypothetical protein [Planktothrix]CAD0224386.1 conserved hypothetical protein [Planktothrix agardhii]CAD5943181.1 hypothetical protein NO758_02045 [Planktothrix agardhii]
MTINDQKNIIDDPLLEQEIKTVTQQSKDTSPKNISIVKFTKDQERMVQILSQGLGLSFQSLINCAIRGTLLYIKEQDKKLKDLQEYPKELGSQETEVMLSVETLSVLESCGMKDQFSECAIVGIKLLYNTFYSLNNQVN